MRGDFSRLVMTAILNGLTVSKRPAESGVKRIHRSKDMAFAVQRYLCPSSVTEISIRDRKSIRQQSHTSSKDIYSSLLNSVALQLHKLPNMQEGWVQSICGWLTQHRKFATTVKKMREHYFVVGKCVMYKHNSHTEAKLQKRSGQYMHTCSLLLILLAYCDLSTLLLLAATAINVMPDRRVTKSIRRKLDNETGLEYCVKVGNQHIKQHRDGAGTLVSTNADMHRTVDVKSTEQAGEAHAKMRNSDRSKDLAKEYNLHRERNRKVLFGWQDLLDATIGMYMYMV